jgi:hypothetical protein
MRRVESRKGPRIAVAVLPMLLAACLGGGVSYPEVEGRYQGTVVVEGQSIPGSLELVQDGGSLDAVFDAPSLGLQARGTGQVSPEGEARLQVEYNLQCPGVAELSGDFGAEAATFRGNVVASDCTGELSGVFDFSR